jgi:hypothetical protein
VPPEMTAFSASSESTVEAKLTASVFVSFCCVVICSEESLFFGNSAFCTIQPVTIKIKAIAVKSRKNFKIFILASS